jgi:putative Mn2+ efflux pump MntP
VELPSLSMSADAFAAALGRGAAPRPSLSGAVRAGMLFGVVEAITPVVDWSLGLAAASYVTAIDHWIAFVLLALVGVRTSDEAVRRRGEEESAPDQPRRGALILVATAVGTAIDAAALGVTLALLNADTLVIALSIGLATFALATLGVVIGRAAGVTLGAAVGFVGGLGLIALGLKILLEHAGVTA